MELALENSIRAGVCGTCAEGGHPNEPVYKMGMCEFCYTGLPHPKATREEIIREREGERLFRKHRLPDDEAAPTLVIPEERNRVA